MSQTGRCSRLEGNCLDIYGPNCSLASVWRPCARRARLLDSICHPTLVRTLHGMFRGDFYLAQCNLYKDPPTWGKHSWHRDAQFFASGRLEGKPISDPDELERRERELIATEASPPRDLHMHIPLVNATQRRVRLGRSTWQLWSVGHCSGAAGAGERPIGGDAWTVASQHEPWGRWLLSRQRAASWA